MSWNPFVLAGALMATALAPQDSAPRYEEERAAKEMFERAEDLARRGLYAEAKRMYPKIAADFPGTVGAKDASRRTALGFLGWKELQKSGLPPNRVDIAVLGEGYTLDHQRAFDEVAEDLPKQLERTEPFKEYESYLNFVRVDIESADSGVDGFGRDYDTALGGRVIGTIQGHVAIDPDRVQAVLAELPSRDDLALVYVRNGIIGTANPGIATIGGTDVRTMIHEVGHAFGGLSDEYTNSNWEPRDQRAVDPSFQGINLSSNGDPKKVPWAHWIAANHPTVGVYEGGGGRVRGYFRPVPDGCVMHDGEFFCPVCREALLLRIYSLVDPIDSCEPPPHDMGSESAILLEKPIELQVRVMQPKTHDLDVRWWILSPDRARAIRTATTGDASTLPASTDRLTRGPLPVIPDHPDVQNRSGTNGIHRLRLSRTQLGKGLHRVICRVKDDAKPRDEAWPWVLRDTRGLLESERAWWIKVE